MKRRAIRSEPLFFERNPQRVRRQGFLLPDLDVPEVDPAEVLPEGLLRKPDPDFPDISEMEVVQHFHRLSQLNYAVDEGLYPLGSCTMKYNPRINEATARLLRPRSDPSPATRFPGPGRAAPHLGARRSPQGHHRHARSHPAAGGRRAR